MCIIFLFSDANINIIPAGREAVVSPGINVSFFCISLVPHSVVSMEWFINGTSSNDQVIPNTLEAFNVAVGGSFQFFLVPVEYNETMISCTALHDDGTEYSSGTSYLLLQGLQ